MSDHGLRAAVKVAAKYSIAEANELLGRLAVRRLHNDVAGRASERNISTADWQELALLGADRNAVDQVLPLDAQEQTIYGLVSWPSLFSPAGGQAVTAESIKSRRSTRKTAAPTRLAAHAQRPTPKSSRYQRFSIRGRGARSGEHRTRRGPGPEQRRE